VLSSSFAIASFASAPTRAFAADSDNSGITATQACSWLDPKVQDVQDIFGGGKNSEVNECLSHQGADGIFNGEQPKNVTDQKLQTSDQPGRFPTSHYDINYNSGKGLNFFQTILGTITNLVFSWSTNIVHIGLWFLNWAFSFSLVGMLADWAARLNHLYHNEFIAGPINLHYICLFLVCLYGGYHIVRGRFGKGIGEILLSGIIFMVLLVITSNSAWPGGYMQDGFKIVGGLAGEVMSMAQHSDLTEKGGAGIKNNAFYGNENYGFDYSDDAAWKRYIGDKCSAAVFGGTTGSSAVDGSFAQYQAHYKQVLCPTVAQIHRAFVEEPYEYANWGQLLSGNYAKVRDNVLLTGPWGAADEIRNAMSGHGGKDGSKGLGQSYLDPTGQALVKDGDAQGAALDNFNNHPSTTRLMVVIMSFIATLISMISITILAISVGIAQFVAAVLFALAPIALACGLLPGGGRTIMIRWLTSLLKLFVIVLVLSNFLVLLTAGVNIVMVATQHQSLIARFAILILIVMMMFVARKKLHEGTGRALSSMGNQLMQMRVGSGGRGGAGGQPWPVRPMNEHHVGGLNHMKSNPSGQWAQGRAREHTQSSRSTKRQNANHSKQMQTTDMYGNKRNRITGNSHAERLAKKNASRVANGGDQHTWSLSGRARRADREMANMEMRSRGMEIGRYEQNPETGDYEWKERIDRRKFFRMSGDGKLLPRFRSTKNGWDLNERDLQTYLGDRDTSPSEAWARQKAQARAAYGDDVGDKSANAWNAAQQARAQQEATARANAGRR
jgi:hypothetical protein